MNPRNMQRKRKNLIDRLIAEGFLKTPKVIEAFRNVPRHLFVLEKDKEHAYIDYPLGINFGQTISAPSMVAIMLELLELKSGDKILEVGAGSGWNAALIGYIIGNTGEVYTTELTPELVDFARANLQRAGCKNVKLIQGDGSKGYPKETPYDKIIVTCACPEIPKPLIEQLKQGGIIEAPVGGPWYQILVVGRKTREGLEKKNYGGCVFVPLRH